MVYTNSPKICCYRTASCRAIDNRPYARDRKAVRIRRKLAVNGLLPAGHGTPCPYVGEYNCPL